jgi:hypothetical protein
MGTLAAERRPGPSGHSFGKKHSIQEIQCPLWVKSGHDDLMSALPPKASSTQYLLIMGATLDSMKKRTFLRIASSSALRVSAN